MKCAKFHDCRENSIGECYTRDCFEMPPSFCSSPSACSQLSIEDKAALWDGLMACDRIRVLGYARGGADGKQETINHIGLELWATFTPAKAVEINTGIERDLLAEFARGVENAERESRGLLRTSPRSCSQAGKETDA